MAGIKISELPATSIILGDDQLILSRGDSTRRVSGNEFLTKVQTAELSASIQTLSATTFTSISALSSTTFLTISALSNRVTTLSATTFTTISALSSEVQNKKRWVDFKS
jgi:hypothetical protein